MIHAPLSCGKDIRITRKSKSEKKSMNLNSRLSKVLNLRQNYLCDFHLRSSAGFSVAVYGWRSLYRLYWGVTTPCIVMSGSASSCIVASGSSKSPSCYIEDLQLPVSFVGGVEFCFQDLYQCSSYRLWQGVTV